MNNKANYKVDDFLKEDGFICYILDVSSRAAMKWECLPNEYSALADEAGLAIAILTGEDAKYLLSPEESATLKKRIFDSII